MCRSERSLGVDPKRFNDELVFQFYFALDRLSVSQNKPSKFYETLMPFVVATARTDFEGNATFEKVPEDEYYIFGSTKTRSGYAVWSYKVSSADKLPILLDNKNAIHSW